MLETGRYQVARELAVPNAVLVAPRNEAGRSDVGETAAASGSSLDATHGREPVEPADELGQATEEIAELVETVGVERPCLRPRGARPRVDAAPRRERVDDFAPRSVHCVHRPMPITDSGASRSRIPVEADHRFRSKPIAERIAR
jgi:hypothetical protein